MLTDLEYEQADGAWIRSFVAAAVEGPTLDFKELVDTTSSRARVDLAKDVSAFANAAGGTIMVGIRERPRGTFTVVGIPRQVGGQPFDEWVANVAAAGVRPRVRFRSRLVSLRGGKCAALFQIPESAEAPHMVELQNDNRIYTRRGKESLPATSDEVTAMFERSRLSGEARRAFLATRRLTDAYSEGLGFNYDSERLAARSYRTVSDGGEIRELSGNPKVLLAYAPASLSSSLPGIRTQTAADRLAVRGLQTSLPMPGLLLLPDRTRTTLDGLYGETRGSGGGEPVVRYLRVFRHGYIEIGLTEVGGGPMDKVAFESSGKRVYHLTWIVGAAANFLGLLSTMHREFSLPAGGDLLVALTKTEHAELGGFGDGWRDSLRLGSGRPPARSPAEPGLLRVSTLTELDLDVDAIRKEAYAVGDDLEAAWGGSEARYLNHDGTPRAGQLNWGLAL